MARFDDLLRQRINVVDLLAMAGVSPEYIRSDRAFTSKWAFDDGVIAVATVWREELDDLDGTPRKLFLDPSGRTDLVGSRRKNALDLYALLVRRVGQPIRVILQKRQEDASKWSEGVSKRRGLDPEHWYGALRPSGVLLQRGSLPVEPLVSLDGVPMQRREPTFALRETRPEQMAFRRLVSAKSNGRCALTNAPPEICEAAHFSWAAWRTDNESRHGLLLRRDLHAALDGGLIEINEEGLVSVSGYLAEHCPEYAPLHGTRIKV